MLSDTGIYAKAFPNTGLLSSGIVSIPILVLSIAQLFRRMLTFFLRFISFRCFLTFLSQPLLLLCFLSVPSHRQDSVFPSLLPVINSVKMNFCQHSRLSTDIISHIKRSIFSDLKQFPVFLRRAFFSVNQNRNTLFPVPFQAFQKNFLLLPSPPFHFFHSFLFFHSCLFPPRYGTGCRRKTNPGGILVIY